MYSHKVNNFRHIALGGRIYLNDFLFDTIQYDSNWIWDICTQKMRGFYVYYGVFECARDGI